MKYIILSLAIIGLIAEGATSREIELNSVSKKSIALSNSLIDHVKNEFLKSHGKKPIGKKYTIQQLLSGLGLSSEEQLEYDSDKNAIRFHGNWTSEHGVQYLDTTYLKKKALDFLVSYASLPFHEFENLHITGLKIERSARETVENGAIKTVSTYNSVGITIGRTAFGLPVFNSYATIVYDLISETIVFLELRNWVEIPDKIPQDLAKWNPTIIENTISQRWKNWKSDVNDDIDVLEAVLGFELISNGLCVAVIHHGKFKNIAPDIVEPQAWIETLGLN